MKTFKLIWLAFNILYLLYAFALSADHVRLSMIWLANHTVENYNMWRHLIENMFTLTSPLLVIDIVIYLPYKLISFLFFRNKD